MLRRCFGSRRRSTHVRCWLYFRPAADIFDAMTRPSGRVAMHVARCYSLLSTQFLVSFLRNYGSHITSACHALAAFRKMLRHDATRLLLSLPSSQASKARCRRVSGFSGISIPPDITRIFLRKILPIAQPRRATGRYRRRAQIFLEYLPTLD